MKWPLVLVVVAYCYIQANQTDDNDTVDHVLAIGLGDANTTLPPITDPPITDPPVTVPPKPKPTAPPNETKPGKEEVFVEQGLLQFYTRYTHTYTSISMEDEYIRIRYKMHILGKLVITIGSCKAILAIRPNDNGAAATTFNQKIYNFYITKASARFKSDFAELFLDDNVEKYGNVLSGAAKCPEVIRGNTVMLDIETSVPVHISIHQRLRSKTLDARGSAEIYMYWLFIGILLLIDLFILAVFMYNLIKICIISGPGVYHRMKNSPLSDEDDYTHVSRKDQALAAAQKKSQETDSTQSGETTCVSNSKSRSQRFRRRTIEGSKKGSKESKDSVKKSGRSDKKQSGTLKQTARSDATQNDGTCVTQAPSENSKDK
ncbi:unnamed protein product [Bursaphelenchus okinawaensis]|uniref:Uncharacterized protein n=1 Tax=Bursaphelenchus okinawaensis TaxID=465554 RepID=A0A811JW59_9BILA|nr:unnamed protein product [Bursaphelenchus okinawaensis]CAG9085124.1 unnamed protein product [Bursaphelenchus okinawaensis]